MERTTPEAWLVLVVIVIAVLAAMFWPTDETNEE